VILAAKRGTRGNPTRGTAPSVHNGQAGSNAYAPRHGRGRPNGGVKRGPTRQALQNLRQNGNANVNGTQVRQQVTALQQRQRNGNGVYPEDKTCAAADLHSNGRRQNAETAENGRTNGRQVRRRCNGAARGNAQCGVQRR